LFTGICGTDIHEFAHGPVTTSPTPHPFTGAALPQILGHEFSGQVEEVGPDVSHVRKGDLVSIQPLVMPMDDYYSLRGLHQGSPRMATTGLQSKWGGLGELAMLNDYNVFKIPEGVSARDGALIEPSAVALSGAERAFVKGGSIVFIAGAGPIGALVVLACAALGASTIIVSEPNRARREQIVKLGVGAMVIDPVSANASEFVRSVADDAVGADSAIECSGTEAGFRDCLAVTRNFGAVAQIGIHTKPFSLNPTIFAQKSLTLSGVWGFPITSWPRILRMVQNGRYPVGKIVTSEIWLDAIVEQGFNRLLDPNSREMKVIVRVQ
jgi:(R,R)-butanediol dehydrogenase/meso-butanediol dehydrogenase/diacetyl reductase